MRRLSPAGISDDNGEKENVATGEALGVREEISSRRRLL